MHPEGLEVFLSACWSLEQCEEGLVSAESRKGAGICRRITAGGEMAKPEFEFWFSCGFLVFKIRTSVLAKPELEAQQGERRRKKRKRAACNPSDYKSS